MLLWRCGLVCKPNNILRRALRLVQFICPWTPFVHWKIWVGGHGRTGRSIDESCLFILGPHAEYYKSTGAGVCWSWPPPLHLKPISSLVCARIALVICALYLNPHPQLIAQRPCLSGSQTIIHLSRLYLLLNSPTGNHSPERRLFRIEGVNACQNRWGLIALIHLIDTHDCNPRDAGHPSS